MGLIIKPILCCPITDVGLLSFADVDAAVAAETAAATIPEVVVSAAAPAVAGGLGVADAAGLGAAGLGAASSFATPGVAGGGAGPPAGGGVATPQLPTAGAPAPGAGTGALCPVTGIPGAMGPPPDLGGLGPADTFGSAGMGGATDPNLVTPGISTVDPSSLQTVDPTLNSPAGEAAEANLGAPAPGFGQSMADWISHPKNALTAGMLGLSLFNAVNKPQLPGAAQTALNASGPAVTEAQQVIASGGMAGAGWIQQKQSIDASIAQQEQQLEAQIKQNAATSGAGQANSGLVQQQISQMKGELETQRQQLYEQAAQQNVSNAVAELTGGNQTLSSIANMELAQQQSARQSALQLASIAAMINQSSIPGG